MEIQEYIIRNREELVAYIRAAIGVGSSFPVDDEEIELWLENDEMLYEQARAEGVEL